MGNFQPGTYDSGTCLRRPFKGPWIGLDLDWILFIVVTITDNCLITIDPLEGKMQKDMNNLFLIDLQSVVSVTRWSPYPGSLF